MLATIIIIVLLLIIIYKLYIIDNETFSMSTPKKDIGCSCGGPSQETCSCNKIDKNIVDLWVFHFLYTRLVMMDFLKNGSEGSGSKSKAFLTSYTKRLIQNQKDIGTAFGKLYGEKVGAAITTELEKHISLAVKVLTSLKEDRSDLKENIAQFYKNADDIGRYLDKLFGNENPVFQHHMKSHIDTLLANSKAYFSGDAASDISTLDSYFNSGMEMAFDMTAKVSRR
jgi:hypothetical protein